MTNLYSTTELTEFVPLSPEAKQSGVTSVFSKLFKFSRDNNGVNESHNATVSNSPIANSASPSPSKENIPIDSNWTVIEPNHQDDISVKLMVSDYQYPYLNRMETRNLPNVLRRVSNLLASKNKQSLVYNDTNLKQYWMPDSVSKECYDCGKKFTYYRRRHHCRICGQIFCANCCNQEVPGKIIGCSGNLRVCTYCCKVVLSYLQENDLSMDLKALQEDLLSKFGDSNDDDAASDASSASRSRTPTELGRRKISVVYQEEKFATRWTESNANLEREKSRNSELASLNTLLQELIAGENPLIVHNQIIDGVRYDSCFAGSQLVDWLIAHRKTQSRTHSLAIGQVLLDANYIDSLTSNSADFFDGLVFYKFTEIAFKSNETDLNPPRENVARLVESNTTTSQSGFRLDLNIHKNTAHISRHPQKSAGSKDKKKIAAQVIEFLDEFIENFIREYRKLDRLSPTPWNNVEPESLHPENNELTVFNSLSDTFSQHLRNAVDQLLALENISLSWAQIIVPLAEAALHEIKLDYNKTDVIHIGHFIQVKKLPGGERKDSFLVRGIVCTKDVAHREMCTRLANPRILLLQCAVVYQRIEGKLLSLEPVMMQEQEYLRNTVARIVSLQPDLVLVHRNVSRIAQESLNSYGITLVLNVKMSVMERVARCTNADILSSVDAHVGSTRLGTCRSFYTKRFPLKDGSTKTLMFFEGCAFPQLGCTILLRGVSEAELKKLKKVTNAVAFMKYNAKLEKSFLLDEFAEPPTVPLFTFIGDTTSPKRNAVPIVSETAAKQAAATSKESKQRANSESTRKDVSRIEDKRVSAKSVVPVDDDPLHLAASRPDDENHSNETQPEELSFAEVPMKRNEFKAALRDTVLSFSPYIQFNLPYLETESGLTCKLRKYFPSDIYYSSPSGGKEITRLSSSDSSTLLKSNNVSSVPMKPVHAFVTTKLKDNANNADVQSLLAMYRACGGRLEPGNEYSHSVKNCIHSNPDSKPPDVNVFDPRNHQRLSVLFCSFSSCSNNSPEFCVSPSIVNMDFYGCNDIPLGSFLERYCFRRSYICPSTTCDTPMIDHERRFVHETGCIQVSLREIESLPDNESLPVLFWTACTVCKLSTPVVALSNDAWNLSFAKYLELRFHAGKYSCRADSVKNCHHSLHQDYVQYFYRSNIVASFKYTDIVLWEISLPPSILEIQPLPIQISVFLDELKKWAVTGHEIFTNIHEKLCSYDTENSATIQGLKKHLAKQRAILKQKTDEIQVILTSSEMNDVSNTDSIQKNRFKLEDSLVSMKKTVAKALFDWKAMLTKLDSNKREDRLKSKSYSSDVVDASQKSSAGSISEDISFISDDNISTMELKDEGSVDMVVAHGDRNDVFDGGSDVSATDFADSGMNQFNCSTSSNETLNSVVTQSSTSDKITVKALLSQLLPNTFQNTGTFLSNPINADEHYVLDFTLTIPLVVYESEPSSIIACALSSNQYLHLLEECVSRVASSSELSFKLAIAKKESLDGVSISSSTESPQILDTDESLKCDGTEENKGKSGKSTDANHFEVSFSDSSTNFTVKVYFAQEFKDVRELVFPAGEEVYIRSLSRCVHWAAHGGKSGSSFCKTKDDRFILKEMSRIELQLFRDYGLNYFNFVRKCHTTQQPTLLAKIVGVYRVKYRNNLSNQTFQSNLLVMENLFYMRDVIRKFDLKGSVRNRLVNTKCDHAGELVLLDENLINMTCDCPLYIYPHSKTVLMKAINDDVNFLASQSIMDYSLLVGLDESSQELVVGIIDYIRTFTWDKRIETMVKKSGLLGGQGKLPTIVSPEEYKNRFIAAMHKYFLAVPDQWQGFGKGIDYQSRF